MEYLKSIGDYKVYKPGKHDALAAIKVSRWTKGAGTMLPKSPLEIMELFEKGDSVIVKNKLGVVLAHAAATATYSDGAVEIGSIYTDEKQRGKGLAKMATNAVLEDQHKKNPDSTLFALGNEMSSIMFKKMGATEMSTSELSSEVWEFCSTCPKRPKEVNMCCDTPYDLTKVTQR